MGQSSWSRSLASTYPVLMAVLLLGCWGSGVARKGGEGASCVSIPVSPAGVVCVAWSTLVGGVGPGLGSVSPSCVGSWTQLVGLG